VLNAFQILALVAVTKGVGVWIGWILHREYSVRKKQPMGTNPPARPPALTPRRFRP
jgi:hypothetical protein